MNGGDFNSFLSGIMSDPEMMSKIKAISDSLGVDAEPDRSDESGSGSETREVSPVKTLPVDQKAKNRAALIRALMPYLSESRREKAEMILKIVSLAGLGRMTGI